MKEILLKYGFNDLGICKVCHGHAWQYSKSVNGLYYQVKTFIRNTRQGIIETGAGNMYLFNGKRIPVNINTLEQEIILRGLDK